MCINVEYMCCAKLEFNVPPETSPAAVFSCFPAKIVETNIIKFDFEKEPKICARASGNHLSRLLTFHFGKEDYLYSRVTSAT